MIGFIFHFLFYKGKNPDEMGQMFKINSAFISEDDEEEAQIRAQIKWAEEPDI